MVTLKRFQHLFFDFHSAFVLVVVCLGVSMVLGGCDFTVTQGEFHGLKIGMSKKEMASELVRQNVFYIEADVSKFVSVTRLTRDKLSQLQNAEAICVSDNQGVALRIAFNQQDMSNVIYKSDSIDLASMGLNASIPRTSVIEIIHAVLLVVSQPVTKGYNIAANRAYDHRL